MALLVCSDLVCFIRSASPGACKRVQSFDSLSVAEKQQIADECKAPWRKPLLTALLHEACLLIVIGAAGLAPTIALKDVITASFAHKV